MNGIIFDFNGTMVFDAPFHEKAWNSLAIEINGKPLTTEQMKLTHGLPNLQIIKQFIGDFDDDTAIQLSKRKEALYREIAKQSPDYRLVPGLEDYLAQCKRKKLPMTIASASIYDNILFFYEHFHLDRYFKFEDIIYDNLTYSDKVQMFIDASKKINVPIKNCLIFEDSYSGIRCANQANTSEIIVIAPKRKHEEMKQFPRVFQVIENFEALIE